MPINRNQIDEGVRDLAVKTITSGMSPYSVLATDEMLFVDTSGGAVIINLLGASTADAGEQIRIKDTGNAGTNNVTVNRAGSDLIDGETQILMTQNYDEIELTSNGVDAYALALLR